MAEKLLNTKRVKVLKFFFLTAAVFTLGMVIYFPNYSRLKALREENENLAQRINRLEREITEYQIKNKRLKEDPFFYEEIARDRLGVSREDEIIVDIGE